MKNKQLKQIIWNPKGENTCQGFYAIEFDDNDLFRLIKSKKTKKLVPVDYKKQTDRLYQGLACLKTDSNFTENFYNINNYYKNTMILVTRRLKGYGTLGKCLKKINKIEHLFPEGTELSIINRYYGTYINEKNEERHYHLRLKYLTKRKFQGFETDFKIDKPELFDNFDQDPLMAKFVIFLRDNGFLVFIYENTDYDYTQSEMGKQIIIGKLAIAYGKDFKVGFTEFNQKLWGYSDACENILFDKKDYFDKWSRSEQFKKPTSEKDFPEFLECLKNWDEQNNNNERI